MDNDYQFSSPDASVTVKDFIKRNMAGSGDARSKEFERQRGLIARVHKKILSRRDFGLDLTGLQHGL